MNVIDCIILAGIGILTVFGRIVCTEHIDSID